MSELDFQVEWESPQGARGPELRATWARLRISVGGQVVTQVEDKLAGSVREAVYGPLYPLAEWIAANWWAVLYEISSPYRSGSNGYAKRHALSAAAEGFALPSLTFEPEGNRIQLTWLRRDLPEARVRFLSSGRQYLDRRQVKDALGRLVSSVAARLEDQGCPSTLLAEEWRAIQEADPEEQDFCKLAGSLGWDPYALSASKAGSIVEAAGSIPEEIREEFFASAHAARLKAQARAVREFIDQAEESDLRLDPLPALRKCRPPSSAAQPPWEQGYRYARALRKRLPMKNGFIRTAEDIGTVLNVDQKAWQQALGEGAAKLNFLDAIMAVNNAGGPCFAVAARTEHSRTFTVCRALFEYLHAVDATAALVAPTRSDRQKRNRAFAAEFLVPAAQLRRKIAGPFVTEEQVQDIAEEFGTSDWVIRHQIANHGLARLFEWRI